MMENFHTHLPYCKHAQGSADEYIASAKALGFVALGFSDHSPAPSYMYDVQGYKMAEDQLPIYKNEVLQAKKSSDLPIFLGMEVDIIQEESDYFRTVLIPQLQPDFLIGSLHYLRASNGRHLGLADIVDQKLFDKYIEQILWAIEQPEFLFIGHPDRIFNVESVQHNDKSYRSAWRVLAEHAVKYDKPLEYNTSKNGSLDPCLSPVLWQEILQAGAKVVVTSDAHHPDRLGHGLVSGYDWLAQQGANVVYCSQLL